MKRNLIKTTTGLLAIIISLGTVTYWILNPSLTEMEILLKLWWVYLMVIVLLIIYNKVK
jgi:hypothetical protein